ncbi:hypothetical protein [Spirosoma linguale]|uniref:Sialate O-acetylesterase domain-containing protein n=1 Tax=Spirosoma linguale (strain ATCC 33905 / DSM 74 / LMG 10896 / Claus 1) TaxID=504472 RepID=D2QGD3_SPILD|nr:hypothetical protein Slin_0677 [Spirosoma linguale DSM 74]
MSTNLLTSPIHGIVYQRDNTNRALVPVIGTAIGASSVTVSITAQDGTKTSLTNKIPVSPNGSYSGSISVPGGWYSMNVEANNGQKANQVERFGVGEVFVKFGHSFMSGGFDQNRQLTANDERVRTLTDDLKQRNYEYGKLTNVIGPFNGQPDAWGQFGDLLVNRLNVPVLIYGCAYGGSSLAMNLDVIANRPLSKLPPGYNGPESRQPFAPLETTLTNYVPKTGIRAILVEHGYNDRGTSQESFLAQLKQFFTYVRETWKMPSLPVVLVQEQLTAVQGSLYDIPTAKAQQEFIANFPAVWKGPDFNKPSWNAIFALNDHLYGTAIDLFAKEWNESLTDSFFKDSTPYPALNLPVNVSNTATANAPALSSFQFIDYAIFALTGILLVLVVTYKSRKLGIGFLLLGLLFLYRFIR